jgi:hypothetical protein
VVQEGEVAEAHIRNREGLAAAVVVVVARIQSLEDPVEAAVVVEEKPC